MKELKLSVLLVELGKCPKVIEIEDTLEAMQNIVGGDIEVYEPFDDEIAIVCNEEGKVKGFPLNRTIYSDRGELVDIIAGAFFVCYAPVDSEKFLSLPEELAEEYEEYFKEPESFNTEAGGVMVIRDTLGYPTYERFDSVGKYYIVQVLSKEVSRYPMETRVIAKSQEIRPNKRLLKMLQVVSGRKSKLVRFGLSRMCTHRLHWTRCTKSCVKWILVAA